LALLNVPWDVQKPLLSSIRWSFSFKSDIKTLSYTIDFPTAVSTWQP
jgi:hypothetical protein